MNAAVKKLAAAAAVCVMIALAVCLGVKPQNAQETAETAEELFVDDIHLSSVAGIVLKNEKGAVPLMVYDGEIQLINAPEDTGADASKIKVFAYRMAHIPAEKCIGKVEVLSEFGLEKPRAVLSVIGNGGETQRIFIGDEAPFEGGYYIKAENDENVYLTDGLTAKMLSYGVDELRKLDVLPDTAGMTLRDLTGFALIHGDGLIEVSGRAGETGMSYELKKPFEAALDWENVANYIYSPLSSLNECSFVSAKGNFSDYGFDGKDVCTVVAVISGKAYTLYFAEASDGGYYAARKGSDQIVKVEADSVPFLVLEVSDLVSDTVYSVNASELSSVRIEAEGLDLTAKITGFGDTLKCELNGRTLSGAETVSLVKALTMLPRAGEGNGTDIGGKYILRLNFEKRDGTGNIIELIPVTDTLSAVIIDGNPTTLTYTSTVKEIIAEVYSKLK